MIYDLCLWLIKKLQIGGSTGCLHVTLVTWFHECAGNCKLFSLLWLDPPIISKQDLYSPQNKKVESKRRFFSCFDVQDGTNLLHPHQYSWRGNNFITPVAASIVATVKLPFWEPGHLQRREGLQITWWDSSDLCGCGSSFIDHAAWRPVVSYWD